MKFKPSPLACLAAASCVFSAVCLFRIGALENQISLLQSNTSNQLNNLQDNVSGLYGQVQDTLEEQANLFSSQTTQYTELDMENRQVWVSCTVCPKEYTPGVTQAFAVLDGQRYPLTLEGDTYTGRLPVPLWSETQIDTVLLVDGDAVRSQAVEWYFNPLFDYLPNVYLSFDGDESSAKEGDSCTHKLRGLLTAEVYASGYTQVEQMDIVAVLDGEEIWRTTADLSYQGQKEYVDLYNKGRSSAIAMPTPEDYNQGKGSSFYFYLDQSWQIPAGSSLQLYADITDHHGLHYWALGGAYTVDSQGKLDIDHELLYLDCSVYDDQGQMLWQADDRLFR